MSDNRILEDMVDKANYHSLTAAINYEYSKKHNYDFIYYRPYKINSNNIELYNCIDPNSKEDRHAAWSKLLSTMIALELNYNYVVYIDSDCIFKDLNKPIEHIINMFNNNDIIFLNDKPYFNHLPNTGFFICKVCENTKNLFKNWYKINKPQKNKGFRWEQDGLWSIYESYNIGIYDSMMMQEEEGQYLRHIHHGFNNDRIPYFKHFIINNNINFKLNITLVQCNSYDTIKLINEIYIDILVNNKLTQNQKPILVNKKLTQNQKPIFYLQ